PGNNDWVFGIIFIDVVSELLFTELWVLLFEPGGHMLHKDAEDREFLKPVVPKGMERLADNLGLTDKVQLVDALYFRRKLLQFSDDFLGSVYLTLGIHNNSVLFVSALT